jgi:hypothetical protein
MWFDYKYVYIFCMKLVYFATYILRFQITIYLCMFLSFVRHVKTASDIVCHQSHYKIVSQNVYLFRLLSEVTPIYCSHLPSSVPCPIPFSYLHYSDCSDFIVLLLLLTSHFSSSFSNSSPLFFLLRLIILFYSRNFVLNPLKPNLIFKNSVRTSQRTPHFTITKINWLTLFKFNPLKTKLV